VELVATPFSSLNGKYLFSLFSISVLTLFDKRGFEVYAIELDEGRLEMAKHNAQIYGVHDKIKWIHGDCLEVLPTLKVRLRVFSTKMINLYYRPTLCFYHHLGAAHNINPMPYSI